MKRSFADARAGCDARARGLRPDVTNQDTGTVVGAIAGGVIGNQFGKGGGKVASTLAGAVVGGIVGNEIGRSLDRARPRARPPGRVRRLGARAARQPVRWRNPDNGRYGEVDPRGALQARRRRLPRLRAPGLHRRPPADHARHRLPQPRRHLDPGRLRCVGRIRADRRDIAPMLLVPQTAQYAACDRPTLHPAPPVLLHWSTGVRPLALRCGLDRNVGGEGSDPAPTVV